MQSTFQTPLLLHVPHFVKKKKKRVGNIGSPIGRGRRQWQLTDFLGGGSWGVGCFYWACFLLSMHEGGRGLVRTCK